MFAVEQDFTANFSQNRITPTVPTVRFVNKKNVVKCHLLGRDVESGNILHAYPSPPGGLAPWREGRLRDPLPLLRREGGVRLRELRCFDIHRARHLVTEQNRR